MGRFKFLLIVLVFVLPFIFAKHLFDNDVTTKRGTTNHGTFLANDINIQNLQDNNHWVILQVIDNTCDLLCQDNMYMLRQIVLDKSETLYNSLTKMDERIFIANPFGKIILGYDNDFVAKGLLKDLKKLLKFSRR